MPSELNQESMKGKSRLVLGTDLDIEEAMEILRDAIDEDRPNIFSGIRGNKDVIGTISGYEIHLRKRQRYIKNSFAPVLHAYFWAHSEGTRVEGRFDFDSVTRVFNKLLPIGVLLIGIPVLLVLLVNLASGQARQEDFLATVVVAGLFTFGILFPKFGSGIARSDRDFLVTFLREKLRARIASSSP